MRVLRTPQGGIISPTLANLTLNGLELEDHFSKTFKPKRVLCSTGKSTTRIATCINLIRYADDFIITGRSERQLIRVKNALNRFLEPRGLSMKKKRQ